jgi:hypothetical protein
MRPEEGGGNEEGKGKQVRDRREGERNSCQRPRDVVNDREDVVNDREMLSSRLLRTGERA